VWLLIATAVWGLSFPIIRTLWLIQRELVPEVSSFFFASLGGCVRFGVAAIIVAIFLCAFTVETDAIGALAGRWPRNFGGLGICFPNGRAGAHVRFHISISHAVLLFAHSDLGFVAAAYGPGDRGHRELHHGARRRGDSFAL
jgi:hypothetical protein